MKIEEIEAVLAAALKLRVPRKTPGEARGALVGRLEDYMLEAAYQQGDLEEAYHYLNYTIALLREKVERLEGYEAVLPSKPADRITKADILAAKRVIDPPTFDAGARARQLKESIKRQIDRIEWAHPVVSRVYTLITGGS